MGVILMKWETSKEGTLAWEKSASRRARGGGWESRVQWRTVWLLPI